MKDIPEGWVTWNEIFAALPEEEQRRIKEGAAQLHAEYQTLLAMRKLLPKARRAVERKLKAKAGEADRIEREADLYFVTLRDYVLKAGGSLEIRLEMPGHPPVSVDDIGDLIDLQTAPSVSAERAA